jgi:dienelactone hydrolase
MQMRVRTLMAAVILILAMATSACEPANPYQRGPAPTAAALETTGPYAVTTVTVADAATPGFGAATIYHPTTTADGTFGGVAIVPGFLGSQSSINWFGPRLASHGFVVITIDTLTIFDDPTSRGTQLLAALDYLTDTSAAMTRVDRTRLAVMGHSMGGGGSLEAAKARPALQAAIPLTGWHLDTTWPEVQTPTLLIGGQSDTVAPVASHSLPMYNSLPASLSKAYLEMAGGSHFVANSATPTVSRLSIAWLKRFVDNDTRYTQFLCPPPPVAGPISAYASTCPYA